MLAHTTSFLFLTVSILMSIFAINFILLAFHLTGARYLPFPCPRIKFSIRTCLSSHSHVLLAFSVLFPRCPSSTYPRTLYILTVFNSTCIPISGPSRTHNLYLISFYAFTCARQLTGAFIGSSMSLSPVGSSANLSRRLGK